MDSKKQGVLHHLRQKMLPHLRRGKTSLSKPVSQFEHMLDNRMSSSVPDIRDMRQEYARMSSSRPPQQYNSPSYSNPSTPRVKSSRGKEGGGSGLNLGVVDGGAAGRSEHRLSVPTDCTDWASSQESLSSLYEVERSALETNYGPARGMEPEELALPEMMTVYSPECPSVEGSQSSSQVQTHHVKSYISINITKTDKLPYKRWSSCNKYMNFMGTSGTALIFLGEVLEEACRDMHFFSVRHR